MTPYTRDADRRRGFTLIELLVVISIIGLLSSVTIASLNTSRNKSKDAAIKAEARQFVSLLNATYDETTPNSYCPLQEKGPGNGVGWIPGIGSPPGSCTSSFYGTYVTQAQQMCTVMYNNAGTWNAPYTIWFSPSGSSCATSYSFMVALNDGKWYCVGSSGRSGEYASYSGQPGCYNNP